MSSYTTAISPLDGRYQKDLTEFSGVSSESNLNRLRLVVEAHWLLALSDANLAPAIGSHLRKCLEDWSNGDVPSEFLSRVKEFESKTNHDVKACEYTLRAALDEWSQKGDNVSLLKSFVHFACTSEDVNNLAYARLLCDFKKDFLLPEMKRVRETIAGLAMNHLKTSMLSRTHGQTATPTTIGKELAVFVRRMDRQINQLSQHKIEAKINGATGGYNAHLVAFPDFDWTQFAKGFVENRLHLAHNPLTTQIECHDSYVEMFNIVRLFNTICLDFCRDMWSYISLGYFAQKSVASETGSSTMPHKVNPIYFENAEGNLGVSNSLLQHFAEKLPVSRMQRDLSDSTVLRTMATAIGHSLLAWKAVQKGMSRVSVNEVQLKKDLESSWEVLGEAIQTVMRRYGVDDAYERLKSATRGHSVVTRDMLIDLIDGCKELPEAEKSKLKALSPTTYIGLCAEIATDYLAH